MLLRNRTDLIFPSSSSAEKKEKQYHYYRIQLKSSGNYLDADYRTTKLALNPGSDFDGGSCQVWRLFLMGDGWSKLQLKSKGQSLDADHCSTKIILNPRSDYAGGACQLWRFMPVSGGWSKLQLKAMANFLMPITVTQRLH